MAVSAADSTPDLAPEVGVPGSQERIPRERRLLFLGRLGQIIYPKNPAFFLSPRYEDIEQAFSVGFAKIHLIANTLSMLTSRYIKVVPDPEGWMEQHSSRQADASQFSPVPQNGSSSSGEEWIGTALKVNEHVLLLVVTLGTRPNYRSQGNDFNSTSTLGSSGTWQSRNITSPWTMGCLAAYAFRETAGAHNADGLTVALKSIRNSVEKNQWRHPSYGFDGFLEMDGLWPCIYCRSTEYGVIQVPEAWIMFRIPPWSPELSKWLARAAQVESSGLVPATFPTRRPLRNPLPINIRIHHGRSQDSDVETGRTHDSHSFSHARYDRQNPSAQPMPTRRPLPEYYFSPYNHGPTPRIARPSELVISGGSTFEETSRLNHAESFRDWYSRHGNYGLSANSFRDDRMRDRPMMPSRPSAYSSSGSCRTLSTSPVRSRSMQPYATAQQYQGVLEGSPTEQSAAPAADVHRCEVCKTSNSKTWRSLCNACGLRYAREQKKFVQLEAMIEVESGATASNGSFPNKTSTSSPVES